jgi:hypothetical protein
VGLVNDNIHPQELEGTGLAPSDFELLNGMITYQAAWDKGFHPDDQHREDQITRHDD